MEARIKLSAPAVPNGRVVEVREVGADGRPSDVLAELTNGQSLVLPVGKDSYDIVLRVKGLTE